METWDTIRARRNVRQYTDQVVAAGEIHRAIVDRQRFLASVSATDASH
jgi:hypothetical protein